MKHFFLLTGILLISITIHAQETFRYDTIRTNPHAPQQYHYETPKFSYDTIQHSRSNQSVNQSKRQNRTSSKSNQPSSASKFDKNKLFFGGNLGMQFGSYTLVDISPQIGYAFNQYISAGAGLRFTYVNAEYSSYEATRTYAGFNLFAHVYPIQNIILSFQPGIDYLWGKDKYDNGSEFSDNRAVPSFVIGGGLRIPTGNTGAITMMLKYDVVQDEYSPFGDSVFYSVGYVFGF